MTMPDLAGAAGASAGAGAELAEWPTTMFSLTAGTAGRTADSAPTTILGGGGGSGSPAKKVAPSCLVSGLGLRWWLVLVRLATV